MNRSTSAGLRSAALGACLALLGGCHKVPASDSAEGATKQSPAAAAKKAAEGAVDGATGANHNEATNKEAAEEGVTLSAEQIQKMGIAVSPAKAASHIPEAAGYAVVIPHEPLAQGAADLIGAQAVERQSGAALARAQRLAGTPGAVSADAMESAARQAAVDRAALELARERLSAIVGQNPPWKNTDESLLDALGSGRIKLVRATFPLGVIEGAAPASLRLARLDAERSGKSWKSTAAWYAPADSSVPGRSFFALLKGSDAAEGERLLAWAPVGAPEAGVAIPAVALIISDNNYWCYLERKPGVFRRVEIDTLRPLADGYFVTTGVAVGEKVVTESAGLLLAREMNPGTAAD